MKVLNKRPEAPPKTVPLSAVRPGDCFYFLSMNALQDALSENTIYLKIESPELKTNRCRCVNVYDGKQLERDDNWQVVELTTELAVQEK